MKRSANSSGFQLSEDISKASQDVGDDLQKAVMDFEQVLTSTTVGRSTTLPRRKGKFSLVFLKKKTP